MGGCICTIQGWCICTIQGGVYTIQRGGGELDMIQRGVYIYHTGGWVYIYTIQEGVFVNILYWGRMYTAQCVPKTGISTGLSKLT